MKTLHYQGFEKPCVCKYAIEEVDGKSCVLLVQGALGNTSITNMVEVLVSRILCDELAGMHPSEVRVFEHYPPSHQPIRAWQEVTFDEHIPIKADKGIFAKLLEVVAGPSSPEVWGVKNPVWNSLAYDQVPAQIRNLAKN